MKTTSFFHVGTSRVGSLVSKVMGKTARPIMQGESRDIEESKPRRFAPPPVRRQSEHPVVAAAHERCNGVREQPQVVHPHPVHCTYNPPKNKCEQLTCMQEGIARKLMSIKSLQRRRCAATCTANAAGSGVASTHISTSSMLGIFPTA